MPPAETGPDHELLAGQGPPRDALLARRALRDLGATGAARAQPRLVPRRSCPGARATAAGQGYPGARWPKQVGPTAGRAPIPIGSFLVWQQPHVLYLLELVWHASDPEKRERAAREFAELVEETATFMAAFAEERDGEFHLLPPVMPAQEFYDVTTTEDPTFELAYWWWGLEIAQLWRERVRAGPRRRVVGGAGRPRAPARRGRPLHGDRDRAVPATRRPPRPPRRARRRAADADHRSATIMTATLARRARQLGVADRVGLGLPGHRDDRLPRWADPTSRSTPCCATRSRTGSPSSDTTPRSGSILPIYLPGNGSLLAAVSMLATTGFPDSWDVATEGFVPWP